MAILFPIRIFDRNLLRINPLTNAFCILFWCLAWRLNSGFTSNKPIFILTQLFAILFTTEIFKPRLLTAHATRLHTRLTELKLPVWLARLLLYKQSNERPWSGMFVYSLSRELYCVYYVNTIKKFKSNFRTTPEDKSLCSQYTTVAAVAILLPLVKH